MHRFLSLLSLLLTTSAAAAAAEKEYRLGDLDLSAVEQGWGSAQAHHSVTGGPLRIGTAVFTNGVGSHAEGAIRVALDGRAARFAAKVGVDAGAGAKGSVRFRVTGDGKPLFDSGVMKAGNAAKAVDVPLAGVRLLVLRMEDGGDGVDFDHADWAEAHVVTEGTPPVVVATPPPPEEPWTILTPPAPKAPRIHGPPVYGIRPGSPFLYRIPCTGERPVTFAARDLPAGLKLDPASGIVSGAIEDKAPKSHRIVFTAKNAHGAAERALDLVVGDALALTPPMGWNHWYTHYNRITDATMREAADVMISSGMADYGYHYVNIDDCWMNAEATGKYQPDPKRVGPLRAADGTIQANAYFPDMKGLADYIHAKGLKAGLYTSPGPRTCAGFAGAHGHEEKDARTFAAWGYDFLKYDWCSYGRVATGEGREKAVKPYRLMGDLLAQQPRDIVYNLCQYGMESVWEWGAEVRGNAWRTTGDLGLEKGSSLPGFYRIGLANARHHDHAWPGHWNDPDYILIGWYGSAHAMGEPQKAKLTPNEQYSYMSMWALMAAPLFFSGDMAKLDAFTLSILCNHEVIAVDQDRLGRQGRLVRESADEFILAKELEDGSLAVGLFNLREEPARMEASWPELHRRGLQMVRDVWRQQDLNQVDRVVAADVPRHGVAFLRLIPAR